MPAGDCVTDSELDDFVKSEIVGSKEFCLKTAEKKTQVKKI